ncbi:hypothetical protein SLEP1_g3099 [Rubroshorea leprosula]|uniref:Knottin scorpion toxin-like domain-containing protein n=1 Tax=Rubroshorea leprosula TaxID=152421 RepID=A0AAV5HQQ1_9ROSI|nr:hypothetical protein SLEP1_g3099 [Rubroshorea leprosula]
MRNFSTFVILLVTLLTTLGNGSVVVSAKTCTVLLKPTPECTKIDCTQDCIIKYGVSAVGRCHQFLSCYCDYPC